MGVYRHQWSMTTRLILVMSDKMYLAIFISQLIFCSVPKCSSTKFERLLLESVNPELNPSDIITHNRTYYKIHGLRFVPWPPNLNRDSLVFLTLNARYQAHVQSTPLNLNRKYAKFLKELYSDSNFQEFQLTLTFVSRGGVRIWWGVQLIRVYI